MSFELVLSSLVTSWIIADFLGKETVVLARTNISGKRQLKEQVAHYREVWVDSKSHNTTR